MLGSTTDVTRQKAREMLSETVAWKSGAHGEKPAIEEKVTPVGEKNEAEMAGHPRPH